MVCQVMAGLSGGPGTRLRDDSPAARASAAPYRVRLLLNPHTLANSAGAKGAATKRRTNPLPVRIYTYGLPLGPADGADLVEAQIAAGHQYYNVLIEIERGRRAAYRELMGEQRSIVQLDERIAGLVGELAAAREALSARRAQARKRVVDKAAAARIVELRSGIKVARGERKAAQMDLRASAAVQARLRAIEANAASAVKAARAATTCYWGTYLLIERAADSARKSVTDPSFRRWNDGGAVYDRALGQRFGAGRIGVQLQGGLTVQALLDGGDSRARLIRAPSAAVLATRSGRRNARTMLQVRIGSDGRSPVWASFPMVLHRALPADGVVKEIAIGRRRVGSRWRWEARLTLEAQSFLVAPRPTRRRCAIDLGWRVREAGLRVGYLVGSDGFKRELLLPREILDTLDHVASLRAIRRGNFNLQLTLLTQWLATQRSVPEWLDEHRQYLPLWKSEARLTELAWQWSRNRFAGDVEIYPDLERWRRRELHLMQWESAERTRALLRRRERYRLLALKVAKRYDLVILAKLDLRQLKRLPAPEQDDAAVAAVRRHRTYAAVGELRQALLLATGNTGAAIQTVDAQHSTSLCHACGCMCQWDHAADLEHTCEHCGERWDQDVNAAENLLASGSAAPNTPGPLAVGATR